MSKSIISRSRTKHIFALRYQKNLFSDYSTNHFTHHPAVSHTTTPRISCPASLHTRPRRHRVPILKAHYTTLAAVLYVWCTHPQLVRIASQFRLCPHRVPVIPLALERVKKLLNVFCFCTEQPRRLHTLFSRVVRWTEASTSCCAY